MPVSATDTTLIIFTRYPRPGRAKTRLIPRLGPDLAATLQRRMTEWIWSAGLRLACRDGVRTVIAAHDGSRGEMRNWLGPHTPCWRQEGPNLGARMDNAAKRAFREGASFCLIAGSDCPYLTPHRLQAARRALRSSDAVMIPATDGGYVLLGLKKSPGDRNSRLFQEIEWGSQHVSEQTRYAAREAGIRLAELETVADVDRPEDVDSICSRDFPQLLEPLPKISVVIPTLNEEDTLAETVTAARTGVNTEITVADGGSSDATRALAESLGATVVQRSGGRSVQMNAGAAASNGPILLFLHADTHLPLGYDTWIRRMLASGDAGAFRLSISTQSRLLRGIAAAANWRSRVLGLPYGDQALFMRRDLFCRIGGFPRAPIMEDYQMVRRINAFSGVGMLPVAVSTSPRRWQKLGIVRTTLTNQAMLAGYHLGVPEKRLASWYRKL